MLHCPRNMMMRTVAYCGFFLATCFTPALAAEPTGDWKVADGVANIRVAECNGSMWGAVAWEKAPGGRDKSNPDASKQSRPTLGMPILIDMKKKAGADQWEGQVYNAKGGHKTAGAPLPKPAVPQTTTAPKPAVPSTTTATAPAKSTAPVNPAPKAAPGQKLQATAQPADTVGD